MVGMSTTTFDETLHPRASTGEFAAKANAAPNTELDKSALDQAYEVANTHANVLSVAAYHAQMAANTAAVDRAMISMQPFPAGATHAVFHFDEDSWESGSYPRGQHFIDANGDDLDEIDEDQDLYDIDTDGYMDAAGFERMRDEEGRGTEYWRIELRKPAPSARFTSDAQLGSHGVHTLAAMSGMGGTGFGEMLLASAGDSESAQDALRNLSPEQAAHLAEKYTAMMQQMRAEIALAADSIPS